MTEGLTTYDGPDPEGAYTPARRWANLTAGSFCFGAWAWLITTELPIDEFPRMLGMMALAWGIGGAIAALLPVSAMRIDAVALRRRKLLWPRRIPWTSVRHILWDPRTEHLALDTELVDKPLQLQTTRLGSEDLLAFRGALHDQGDERVERRVVGLDPTLQVTALENGERLVTEAGVVGFLAIALVGGTGAWVSGEMLGLGLISPGAALLVVFGSVVRAWFVARVDVREAGLVVRSLWRWGPSTVPWHQIIDLRGGVYARSGYVRLLLGTGRAVATRVCLDPMQFARLERTVQLRAIEQPFA
ncbi:MAG: hypothetical protein AB7T63_13965 [Planctomycetota bacterium]